LVLGQEGEIVEARTPQALYYNGHGHTKTVDGRTSQEPIL